MNCWVCVFFVAFRLPFLLVLKMVWLAPRLASGKQVAFSPLLVFVVFFFLWFVRIPQNSVSKLMAPKFSWRRCIVPGSENFELWLIHTHTKGVEHLSHKCHSRRIRIRILSEFFTSPAPSPSPSPTLSDFEALSERALIYSKHSHDHNMNFEYLIAKV